MTARGASRPSVSLALGLWLFLVPGALAYVDPGSGSFFFQLAIGAALAAGLAVKGFWRRLFAAIRPRRRRASEDD